MNNPNRKLKNYLINPRYQMRYIFWVTGTGFLLVTSITAIFYSFVRENYELLVELSPMTNESKEMLFAELTKISLILVGTSILFLGIVAIIGLIFSHRTVGPLYRFQQVFQSIQKGNHKQRLKLRPSDDFQDVALSFNKMMDSIQEGTQTKH